MAQRVKETYDAGAFSRGCCLCSIGVTNDLIARKGVEWKSKWSRDGFTFDSRAGNNCLDGDGASSVGFAAVSRTGREAGILTDPNHTRARIKEISGGDIREQLDAGKVVILAGFQGHSDSGEITTLGRGGSDLSAIAQGHFVPSYVRFLPMWTGSLLPIRVW